jgi:uncharacterized membrane protein
MEPAINVSLLWSLFIVAHVGLGAPPVRDRLVDRLGELGFGLVFSAVAAVLFAPLVLYYSAHRFEGAPGLALGAHALGRAALEAAVAGGVVLMAAGLASYPRSPYTVLDGSSRWQAFGLQRVTRHPFFMGLGVFAAAHTLLATRLVGATFMAGFAVLAVGGAALQDRKLLARRGESFARYLTETSAVPFGAILSGRQDLAWGELPLGGLLVGCALAVALRGLHQWIFAYGGALFVGATLGVPAVILVRSLARLRRARRREGVRLAS